MPTAILPWTTWADWISGTVNPNQEVTAETVNNLQTLVTSTVIPADGYGAWGDNTHDDTTFLQNAINAVATQGGGAMQLGAHTYLTTGTLQVPSNVAIIGAGPGQSSIHYTGSGAAIVFQNAQAGTPTATVNASLTGFGIQGSALGTYAIDMKCAQQCFVGTIAISGFTNSGSLVGVGLRLTGYHNATTSLSVTCSNNTFVGVVVTNCQYGVYGVGGNTGATDSDVFGNKFIGCSFLGSGSPAESSQATVAAVFLDLRCRQNTFTNCIFQHGSGDLVQVADAGNTFAACEAQYGNGHAFTFKNTSSGNSLVGCTAQTSTFVGAAVSDSGSGNDVLSIGDGATTTARTTAINGAVTLGAVGTALTVTNNALVSGNLTVSGVLTLTAITASGLITGTDGLTISGAAVSLNASSNFNTAINTGSSTGTVSIGNAAAGALTLASGAASSFAVTGNSLTLETLTSGALILTAAGALTLTAGAASTWTITGGLTIASALTLSAAGTALSVTDNATVGGVLTLSGAGTALSVTNNATIGGTLAVTGNLTAPVLDKGGQYFNVKAYGAVGDGVTNDTTAIQNALNAAATANVGGIVYFPPGVYLHGAVSLTLHSAGSYTTPLRVIAAPGAVFRPNANNVTMYAITIENLVLGPTFQWEGGQFDCNTGARTGCTAFWTQDGYTVTIGKVQFYGAWAQMVTLHNNATAQIMQSESWHLYDLFGLNVNGGINFTTSGNFASSFDNGRMDQIVISLAQTTGLVGVSVDANSEMSGNVWTGVTVYLTADNQKGFDFFNNASNNILDIAVQAGPYVNGTPNPPTAAYGIVFETGAVWGSPNQNTISYSIAGTFTGTGVIQIHVQAGTGTGYNAGAPTVTIATPGGGGAPASAVATLSGTTVNPFLTIVQAGYGYSAGAPPAVTFSASPTGITAVADSVVVASLYGVHNLTSAKIPIQNRSGGYVMPGDGVSLNLYSVYDAANALQFQLAIDTLGNVEFFNTGAMVTGGVLGDPIGFQFLNTGTPYCAPITAGNLYLYSPGINFANPFGVLAQIPLVVDTRNAASGDLQNWRSQGTTLARVTSTGGFNIPSLTVSGAGVSTAITNNVTVGGTLAVNGLVTLSAAGTALSVTNNATIAGVLTLSGAGTALSVTNNVSIGGTATITGTTTTPVFDKGGQIFNVKAYGAKGDGSTNDAAAIQAAIAAASAAGGGRVYLPPATYIIASPLQLASGVWITGGGQDSVIKASGILAALIQAPSTTQIFNTGIADITLHGNSTAVLGLDASYLANCYIQNLITEFCTSHGFNVSTGVSAPGLIIRNLRTAHNGGDGCHIASSNGTQIMSCYSLLNTGSGLYLSGGECFVFGWDSDQDGDRGIFAVSSNRTLLHGCVVSNNTAADGTSIEIRTSSECRVDGCRILTPNSVPYNYFAIYCVGSSTVSIAGCIVEGAATVQNVLAAFGLSGSSNCSISESVVNLSFGQTIYEDNTSSNNTYFGNTSNAPLASTFSGSPSLAITQGSSNLISSTSAGLTIQTRTSGTLAVTSAGALTLTGAANSTWDLGAAHTLSIQTANNGPITTGTGLLTVGGSVTAAGLITGQLGLTVSGAAVSLNVSSNFAVNIATGTSTGAVSIGNSLAGALVLASGTASSFIVTGNNLTLATASSGAVILSSAGAVTITGNAASTWDLGAAHTLSIQTTNNGAITTGTGLLTVGGALTANGGILNLAVAASFNANVLTGASTGALHLLDGTGTGTIGIGNSAAGALTLASGSASSFSVTAANLTLQTLTSGTLALTSAGAINHSAGAASTWTLPSVVNALAYDTNTLSIDASNHRVGIGNIAPAGLLDVSKSGLTGAGSLTGRYFSVSASTFTVSNNADHAFHSIAAPTLAASGATTTANVYTLYIAGAPAAGVNETITNAWALGVNGPVNLISTLLVGGAVTLSSTLTVSGALTASSGGTGLSVTNNMTVGGFIAIGTNPAGTGGLRMANNSGSYARNAGNTADITVSLVDGSNRLFHGDSVNTAGQTYDVSTGNTHLLRVNGVTVVTVAGNAVTLAQPVSITAAGTGLAVTNNATVGGTLGVTGITTLTGGLGGNLIFSVDSTWSIGTAASAAGNRPWNIFAGANVFAANGMGCGVGAQDSGASFTIDGGGVAFHTDNSFDLGLSIASGDGANRRPRDINGGRDLRMGGNGYFAGTFIQIGGVPATTGAVRLPNAAGINFRNALNSADLSGLKIDGSNNITLGDANAGQLSVLTGTGSALVLQAIAGQNQLTINGTFAAATTPLLTAVASDTMTGAVTDGFTGALRLTPSLGGAFAMTRLNYIDLQAPGLSGGATVTDAAAMRFNAAAGTHPAIRGGNTKTTWTGAVDAWMKVNVNGALMYIPMWSSPTA